MISPALLKSDGMYTAIRILKTANLTGPIKETTNLMTVETDYRNSLFN